jgi:hypothetical protein
MKPRYEGPLNAKASLTAGGRGAVRIEALNIGGGDLKFRQSAATR